MLDLIEKIDRQLRQPLPGIEAQYRMATALRYTRVAPPPTAVDAAVLALLYPKGRQWHLVLIERTSRYETDRHRGQISFPGGRYELGDADLAYTALRETEEEIGVHPEEVRVLGKLTELYIPVSNFLVHPFVAFTETKPVFVPEPSEVEAILEVPFDYFRSEKNVQRMDMTLPGNIRLDEVPYFNINGKVLWGATAMMISELLALLD